MAEVSITISFSSSTFSGTSAVRQMWQSNVMIGIGSRPNYGELNIRSRVSLSF